MLLEDTADDSSQKGAPVGEVVVDGRLGDRGLSGDVVKRRTADPTFAPEPIGGLKDPSPSRGHARLLGQGNILPTGR